MSKFYAVLDGHSRKPMILRSWDACRKEVTGAKGVKFKSFPTEEDALEFIAMHGRTLESVPESDINGDKAGKEKKEEKEDTLLGPSEVVIYVDGSYQHATERYAYGMVVVKGDEEIHTESQAVRGEFSAMRNVAGEVLGAMKAITYAVENGYQTLYLHFDYQGIESWALGTWKRNNDLTAGYHAFYSKMRAHVEVRFIKVKGHSGDRWNDRADEIAKSVFTAG